MPTGSIGIKPGEVQGQHDEYSQHRQTRAEAVDPRLLVLCDDGLGHARRNTGIIERRLELSIGDEWDSCGELDLGSR